MGMLAGYEAGCPRLIIKRARSLDSRKRKYRGPNPALAANQFFAHAASAAGKAAGKKAIKKKSPRGGGFFFFFSPPTPPGPVPPATRMQRFFVGAQTIAQKTPRANSRPAPGPGKAAGHTGQSDWRRNSRQGRRHPCNRSARSGRVPGIWAEYAPAIAVLQRHRGEGARFAQRFIPKCFGHLPKAVNQIPSARMGISDPPPATMRLLEKCACDQARIIGRPRSGLHRGANRIGLGQHHRPILAHKASYAR